MNKEVLDKIREIKEDRESGASELAKKALNTIIWYANSSKSNTSKEYLNELKEVCERIVQLRPSMAVITNITSYSYYSVVNSNIKEVSKLKKFTISFCKDLLKELVNTKEKVARNFIELIDGKVRVLTHSYSSNVVNSLIFAKNKIAKVYVTESRPLLEGKKTAKLLANSGVKVAFIVDFGVSRIIEDIDFVVLGCDSILPNGSLVNKLGSYLIALAANQHSKEVFVVTESWKVSTKKVLIEEKEPKEVWDINEIEVKNPYFDITPAYLITKYITEEGVMNLSSIKEKVREFKTYLSLLED